MMILSKRTHFTEESSWFLQKERTFELSHDNSYRRNALLGCLMMILSKRTRFIEESSWFLQKGTHFLNYLTIIFAEGTYFWTGSWWFFQGVFQGWTVTKKAVQNLRTALQNHSWDDLCVFVAFLFVILFWLIQRENGTSEQTDDGSNEPNDRHMECSFGTF